MRTCGASWLCARVFLGSCHAFYRCKQIYEVLSMLSLMKDLRKNGFLTENIFSTFYTGRPTIPSILRVCHFHVICFNMKLMGNIKSICCVHWVCRLYLEKHYHQTWDLMYFGSFAVRIRNLASYRLIKTCL